MNNNKYINWKIYISISIRIIKFKKIIILQKFLLIFEIAYIIFNSIEGQKLMVLRIFPKNLTN